MNSSQTTTTPYRVLAYFLPFIYLLVFVGCEQATIEPNENTQITAFRSDPCPIGSITDHAHDGLPRINGKLPRNGYLRGDVYPNERLGTELVEKYPNSVRFTNDGFPDFSPYAKDLPNGKKAVKPQGLNGDYNHDKRLAEKAAGFDETPSCCTWHHVEDGETLQLVPRDIHRKVGHTGGAAKIKGDPWVVDGD